MTILTDYLDFVDDIVLAARFSHIVTPIVDCPSI